MKQLKALSGADLGAGYTARASGEKITADMLDSVSLFCNKICVVGFELKLFIFRFVNCQSFILY